MIAGRAMGLSLLVLAGRPAEPAPWFALEGTAGGALRTPASYAGRTVLLMYEDRQSEAVNAALKTEVARRIDAEKLQRALVVVPVADLRAYRRWPARGIARAAVRDRARALGAEILLDWTGEIRAAYRFHTPGSNVALIGRDGTLLYRHSGALDQVERQRFHRILSQALSSGAIHAQQQQNSIPAGR